MKYRRGKSKKIQRITQSNNQMVFSNEEYSNIITIGNTKINITWIIKKK